MKLNLILRASPILLVEKFAGVQPMSDEAFAAYKKLAKDTTWSYGKCYFRKVYEEPQDPSKEE